MRLDLKIDIFILKLTNEDEFRGPALVSPRSRTIFWLKKEEKIEFLARFLRQIIMGTFCLKKNFLGNRGHVLPFPTPGSPVLNGYPGTWRLGNLAARGPVDLNGGLLESSLILWNLGC